MSFDFRKLESTQFPSEEVKIFRDLTKSLRDREIDFDLLKNWRKDNSSKFSVLKDIRVKSLKQLGFAYGPFYHGAPDIRWMGDGNIKPLMETVSVLKDKVKLSQIEERMSAVRGDDNNNIPDEYFSLLSEAAKLREDKKDYKPFFLTENKMVAATYADDRRSFDYQNAIPDVVEFCFFAKNPKIINAHGLDWGKRGGPRKQYEQILEAKEAGHDALFIENTRDSYNVTSGTPRHNVYVVFHPSQIKSAEPILVSNGKMLDICEWSQQNGMADGCRVSGVCLQRGADISLIKNNRSK